MSNLNTGNIIDPRNPDATRSPAWFVARAWERGELLSASMQAEAQKYFDAALANNDGASMNPAHLGHAVNLVEPNVTLPTDAQGASFALYDTLHAVVIDEGVGPSNACVVHENGRDIIAVANRETNEAALYFVE